MLGPKNIEDLLEPRLVHDVANTDEVEIACGNPDDEVVLGDDAED